MKKILPYLLVVVLTSLLTGALVAFLLNIRERKEEAKSRHIDVVELTEQTVDPSIWGRQVDYANFRDEGYW
jgi:nitrite reductase (cytochrome c-552)